LALTTPDISEQKIVGLHAVLPGNNWVAFTLSGAYTVDWGDGNTENFAAGATAYRNLAWSSYDTSTLTTRGYRQAIITITPQSGHNITSWNFLVKHNQPGLANGYSTGWLDMRLCTPHVTSRTYSGSAGQVWHRMIEKWQQIDTSAVTSTYQMFYGCWSLQSVTLDTSAVTSTSEMFASCWSLQSVTLDTSAVTDTSWMFYNCSSLQSVTLTGLTRGVSVANASLSSTALDALYTSLGTAAGSQTITVSGNYGTTGDDPSIATAKAWTVSGS
jgi:hypothetical protein